MEDDPIRQPMHGESNSFFAKSTIALFVVLVIAVAMLFLTYRQYQGAMQEEIIRVEPAPIINDSEPDVPSANDVLLEKVGNLMELPKDSTPEISKVKDAEILKESQSFFENVEVGDVLILYDDFAVIYREEEDIIINSGKVDNSNPVDEKDISEEVLTDAPGADTTVEVRNGTVINGYAGRTKNDLVTLAYTILTVGNASKKTYTEPILVKKNNVNDVAVKALEKMFNTTATIDLPEGEAESAADILIILGGAE